MDILEQHYGRVREDEQLLVDFPGFADKVAWLLQQCCGPETRTHDNACFELSSGASYPAGTVLGQPKAYHTAAPAAAAMVPPGGACRFRAILQVAGAGAGTFKLVETNTFKDLPHLTLQLRAGTDASTKQVRQLLRETSLPAARLHLYSYLFTFLTPIYLGAFQFLAFRLGEVKAECAQLTASLHEMHAAKNGLEAELRNTQVAAARASEEHIKQLENSGTTIKDLKTRLEAAEASSKALSEQLAALHAEHAAARERIFSLEEEGAELASAKSELEVELAERLTQLQEATVRAEGAEAAAGQVAQRCQGFEAALRQADMRIEEWKKMAAGHESKASDTAAEVVSLRDRCAATAQENAKLMQQLQEKIEAVAKAEKETAQVRDALYKAEYTASEAGKKRAKAEEAAEIAQKAANKAAAELEETKTKVQSNDKMIAWLNKQLTAAQLNTGNGNSRPRGPSGSSVAPSAAAPLSSMPSAATLRSFGGTTGMPLHAVSAVGTPSGAPMPLTPGKSWCTITPEHSTHFLDRGFHHPGQLEPIQTKANNRKPQGEKRDGVLQSSEGKMCSNGTPRDSLKKDKEELVEGPEPRPPLPRTALFTPST